MLAALNLSSGSLGIGLLALSAFLHALWNSWVKREPEKEAFLGAAITVGCALAWVGVFTLARPNSFEGLGWSLAAGFFEGSYLVSLTRTLRRASLAWAYALMRGGAMAFVWVLSSVLLGERTGILGVGGAILIFAGLWLPVLRSEKGLNAQGFRAAMWSAVFIAGYHFCYDRALEEGAEPFRLFAVSLSVSLPFLAVNLHRLKQFPQSWRLGLSRPAFLLICGSVVYWSFILFLMGLQSTGAGFAISLRNTSIFYALVLAHFSGERITRLQIGSCALIFSGALLLGLA